MGLGRDFDLRLQEFSADTARTVAVSDLKKSVRCLRWRCESLAIRKKILFLNAELKQFVGRKGTWFVTRRNERADVKSPVARIKPKFHASARLFQFSQNCAKPALR
jgi:hypothetical protein